MALVVLGCVNVRGIDQHPVEISMKLPEVQKTTRTPTFHERHEMIDPDPMYELARRQQLWASAPDGNGESLSPAACIVPLETVAAAIDELAEHRRARWFWMLSRPHLSWRRR